MIGVADALAAHEAIHGGESSMTLAPIVEAIF